MPVKTLKNQYRGINPHLHSQWQSEHGDWNEFHLLHIAALTRHLRHILQDRGYEVRVEKSLQIRRVDDSIRTYPESDLAIFDPDPVRSDLPRGGEAILAQAILPNAQVLDVLDEPIQDWGALGVYEKVGDWREERGQLIVWLELLSPSNKPHSYEFKKYHEKRLSIIMQGVVFVELDYLHESPPTLGGIPSYAHFDPDSYPYRIAVIDPHPDWETGQTFLNQWRVDEPIPSMAIPLSGQDRLTVDFDVPYQTMFVDMLLGQEVDYSKLPLRFSRYAYEDQERILRRLITVLQPNADWDSAPLPLVDTTSGLKELQAAFLGLIQAIDAPKST